MESQLHYFPSVLAAHLSMALWYLYYRRPVQTLGAVGTLIFKEFTIPETNNPDAVLITERVIDFTPAEIYAAFQQPERLAQWWGPNGFTNTFEQFDFTTGGNWVFVMHGPNGANYPNENVFEALVPGEKVVIRHISQPHFTLTVTLAPNDGGTHLIWEQEFETAELAEQLRHICEPANEENLDRLETVLRGETPSG